MFKKFVSIILALASCLCFSAAALAAEPAEQTEQTRTIEPRYVSGSSVYSELTISGRTATLSSDVNGKQGTTKISVTHVLQKKSGSGYSDVSGSKSTKSVSKGYISLQTVCSVTSGATYRVKTTAKITGTNGTDTVTKYSNVVTYR